MSHLQIQNWGRIPYAEAWACQKELVDRRIRDEIPDTLVFCEHPAIITLGRASQRGERPVILDPNIEVLEIERGGHATYHGPGQIVAYPIFKLGTSTDYPPSKRGVHGLIRALETWIIEYVRSIGINADRVPEKTGVWVNGSKKIASIGIAARHWVSYHGVALNLSTGLEPWKSFNPCGFESSVMSDISIEIGMLTDAPSWNEAVDVLAAAAPKFFGEFPTKLAVDAASLNH